MRKEKKIREHKFLNKHTIAGVLLLMFGNFIVFNILAAVIGSMLLGRENGAGAGGVIGSVIALILWCRYFQPEYKWKPEPGD